MKVRKSLILASVLAVLSASVMAEEVTFTSLSSPGGGTDRSVDGVIEYLKTQGITAKKQFVKSCVDGLNQVVANPKNHFLVTVQGNAILSDRSKAGDQCPALSSLPVNLELYSPLKGSMIYLCSSPKFEGTSFTRIKALASTGRKIRIGVTEPSLGVPVAKMFDTQLPDVKYVILPYSTPELALAAQSGDVDMVVSTATVKKLVEQGGTCLARSARSDMVQWSDKPLPFYGEIEPGKPVANFAESLTQSLLLADKATVSPAADKAMKEAFKSKEFRDAIAKIPTDHLGLGDGISNEVSMKRIADFEKEFANKAKAK